MRSIHSYARSISIVWKMSFLHSKITKVATQFKGVPAAAAVLLNLIPILPERPRGMLGADARIVVRRVVLRLLRQLPTPEEVERVAREVLPKISTSSSRFHLILLVGHRGNAGHKLISTSAAEDLEAELVDAVRAAEPNELAKEWDLLRLLYWVQEKVPVGASALRTHGDLDLNAKILTGALAEVRIQAFDSRVVTRKQRLQWDVLIKLYGSEEILGQVITSLEGSRPSDQAVIDVIALAKRYLEGWRPKDFGDDDLGT